MSFLPDDVTENIFGSDVLYSCRNLREMFEEADEDDDGFLSTEDFTRLFKENNTNMTDDQIQLLVDAVDVSRDGSISYLEFLQAFAWSGCAGTTVEPIHSDPCVITLGLHPLAIRRGCELFERDPENPTGLIAPEDLTKVVYALFEVLGPRAGVPTENLTKSLMQHIPKDRETGKCKYDGYF